MAEHPFSPPEPGPRSVALFERACRVLPGGVSSPVRSFASVGGTPYVVAQAKGSRITDVDGREYLDYVQSFGASILGHADPEVVAAITQAAARGTSFGAPTENEILLAEAVTAAVRGCDLVRFTSSGTEAVMTAVRVARGATERDRVVKFAGCYHGHSDALLAGGGSGVATYGLPGSAGVPRGAVADTVVTPYNVVPELDERVACVLVEPVAANMGLVLPRPGFLDGLRRACDEVGALLIFDEVITGFRLGLGGATADYGVSPDLWCFGKVIGGGLPLAAVGGRREILEHLAPGGDVYQAGTLSGNPLATAAGLAVLGKLRAEDARAYETLNARAGELVSGLGQVFADAGIPAVVSRAGPIVGLAFAEEPLADFDDAAAAAASGRYVEFFRGMLERGVALAPSPYEVIFPSLAHSAEDIEATVEVARVVAASISKAT